MEAKELGIVPNRLFRITAGCGVFSGESENHLKCCLGIGYKNDPSVSLHGDGSQNTSYYRVNRQYCRKERPYERK
jgi:hypothetical protein